MLFAAAAASGVSASGARTVTATRLMAMLLLPLLSVVIVLAPLVLPAVRGSRWSGMVVPFELLAAAGSFASKRTPFDLPHLALGDLGGFLALVPPARVEPLHSLADACVSTFDAFRRLTLSSARMTDHRHPLRGFE